MQLKGKKVVMELSEGILVLYEDMWSNKAVMKIPLEVRTRAESVAFVLLASQHVSPIDLLITVFVAQNCSVSRVGATSLIVRTFATSYVFQCAENDAQEWYESISIYIIKANEAVQNVRLRQDADYRPGLIFPVPRVSRRRAGCS